MTRLADGEPPRVVDSPATARRSGIAYVPRERRNEALFEQLSIRENFGLPTLGEDSVGGSSAEPDRSAGWRSTPVR